MEQRKEKEKKKNEENGTKNKSDIQKQPGNNQDKKNMKITQKLVKIILFTKRNPKYLFLL